MRHSVRPLILRHLQVLVEHVDVLFAQTRDILKQRPLDAAAPAFTEPRVNDEAAFGRAGNGGSDFSHGGLNCLGRLQKFVPKSSPNRLHCPSERPSCPHILYDSWHKIEYERPPNRGPCFITRSPQTSANPRRNSAVIIQTHPAYSQMPLSS